ncbi:MAG TPA: hypothetical protein VKF32_08465, partial [Thermoanaerobaculia bacterium]|nr:hypothetical protein [Thermoanaerobaculia bacterium]
HYASLAHGTARGRIGWWERRARRRMRTGDYRFGRLEAKAFDLCWRAEKRFGGAERGDEDAWESGDGSHAQIPAITGSSGSG